MTPTNEMVCSGCGEVVEDLAIPPLGELQFCIKCTSVLCHWCNWYQKLNYKMPEPGTVSSPRGIRTWAKHQETPGPDPAKPLS